MRTWTFRPFVGNGGPETGYAVVGFAFDLDVRNAAPQPVR
jgi:hypothetical protein